MKTQTRIRNAVLTVLVGLLLEMVPSVVAADEREPLPPPKFRACASQFDQCRPSKRPESREEMDQIRVAVESCIEKLAQKESDMDCLQELKFIQEKFKELMR
jgi:hypothetical protein